MCRPPPAWNWRSSTAAPSRRSCRHHVWLAHVQRHRRGHGWYCVAEVALVVDPAQADRPPKAVDDKATSASVSIPIDLIANIDPDGDPLLIVSVTQPPATVGRWSRLAAHGAVHTRPRLHRLWQFQYTISDPFNQTSTATVIVTVIAARISRWRVTILVSVFAGEVAMIAARQRQPPRWRRLRVGWSARGPRGAGDPGSEQHHPVHAPLTGGGPFVLTYTIKDEFGRTATASITVTVLVRPPDNRPPTAKDDLAGTTFNNPVTVDVLANDNDADGDAITLDSTMQPAAGQASIVGTAVRFHLRQASKGLLAFKYTISDTAGEVHRHRSHPGRARVLVSPIANPDLVPPPLLTGATTTIRPTDNDIDPDAPNSELRVSYLGSPPD